MDDEPLKGLDTSPPPKPSLYFRIGDALTPWIFFGLIAAGAIYYSVHLTRNYLSIHKDIQEKAAIVVTPEINKDDVTEIGYIFSMRRDNSIREGTWNLVWFIAIPEKGVRYSCQYEEGFQGFKVGDGVKIIHKNVDVADAGVDSYIVGLHDNEAGKAAIAWTNDLDVLEMEREPDEN